MSKSLLALPFALLAACATGPEMAPLPDAAMASRSGTQEATLKRGHAVYLAHCGRCHEHIMPKDVSRKDWHVVVPGMAVRTMARSRWVPTSLKLPVMTRVMHSGAAR